MNTKKDESLTVTPLHYQKIFEKGLEHDLLYQHRDAFSLFKQAADGGYLPADLSLAIAYKHGWGVHKNVEQENVYFERVKENLAQFQSGELETKPFFLYCLGEVSVYDKDRHHNLKPAAEYFQQAAKLQYTAAQYKLGLCYHQGGYGVEKNVLKAIECFELADKAGIVAAIWWLGSIYFFGRGVTCDKVKAIPYLQRAAERGHVKAKFILGEYYLTRDDIPRDEKQGVHLIRQAAEHGLALAETVIGLCYLKGIGVTIDSKQAFTYYQKAVDQGEVSAECNLGYCYLHGLGVTADAKKAVGCYERAMEQGVVTGMNNLGHCYLHGVGVTKDPKKAASYFQQAADQGETTAQYHLSYCLLKGVGVVKDEIQAIFWLERSASGGNSMAVDHFKLVAGIDFSQYTVRRQGIILALQKSAVFSTKNTNISGLEKFIMDYFDPTETAEAVKNEEDAKSDASKISLFGFSIGGLKKEDRIANLFRLKADLGEMEAQFQLGKSYENGMGVKKDSEEAVKFYLQAAKQGHKPAWEALVRLPVEVAKWYQFGATLGYAEDQFKLGRCYELGRGISLDMQRAMQWYEKAAKRGHKKAREAFERFRPEVELAELLKLDSFATQRVIHGKGLISDVIFEYLEETKVAGKKFELPTQGTPKERQSDAERSRNPLLTSSSSCHLWGELQQHLQKSAVTSAVFTGIKFEA